MACPKQMLDMESQRYKGKKKNELVKARSSLLLSLILIVIPGNPHGISETFVIIYLQKIEHFLKGKT